jgi:hypothetical protein
LNNISIEDNKKPTTCINCPLKHSHDCGEITKKQETVSGARAEKILDSRCKLRE